MMYYIYYKNAIASLSFAAAAPKKEWRDLYVIHTAGSGACVLIFPIYNILHIYYIFEERDRFELRRRSSSKKRECYAIYVMYTAGSGECVLILLYIC